VLFPVLSYEEALVVVDAEAESVFELSVFEELDFEELLDEELDSS
jgi:hypothetical protein